MERFDKLSEEMELMRQRCEALLEAQESKHHRQLDKERTEFERIIKERTDKIKQLTEDVKYNEVKFEEILQQQEKEYEGMYGWMDGCSRHDFKRTSSSLTRDDARKAVLSVVTFFFCFLLPFSIQCVCVCRGWVRYTGELLSLRDKKDKDIAAERKERVKKQSELTSKDNKFDALSKKVQEMKVVTEGREAKYQEEIAKNVSLDKTLAHYEQHMQEREVMLAEKERTILALRSTNRTLDNFRFVLDHRLQQFMEVGSFFSTFFFDWSFLVYLIGS
jgi:hypothetical protein